MTTKDAVIFIAVRTLGNFLLLFALFGVCATFGPALYYQARYEVIAFRGIHYTVSWKQPIVNNMPFDKRKNSKILTTQTNSSNQPFYSFASVLAGSKEQIIIPADTSFSVTIPKIGASAKVFPNVDPNNPDEYLPILQKGIAHAKGSVFPGMPGNVYLFAHSTDNWWDVGRYNAVFYLLKDLTTGDDIVVFFEGKRNDYTVSNSVITDPSDISLLSQEHSGGERLILQTCWPPGTTWKRLYVIATPKKA